jgi:RsiW-degrading membrane proteinase PrsW (M82 family)
MSAVCSIRQMCGKLSPMLGLPRRTLFRAALLLALAEAPIVLQLCALDRSYLFFAFGLAWAIALYGLIEPPAHALPIGLLVFAATALLSVPLLLVWLQLSPGEETASLTAPLMAETFWIGVREELCKAVALLAVLWIGESMGRRFSSREGLFYGAMSGLAFAAVENLHALRNLSSLDPVTLVHGAGVNVPVAAALSRLVLTPLAHACWAAAVGFAASAPGLSRWRRLVLSAGALLLTASLHGLYDLCARLANTVGVGVLLALSFGLLLFLISRAEPRSASLAGRPPRVA